MVILRLLLDTTQYVHAASFYDFYQSSASLACVIRSSFDALKTFFLCAVRNTIRTENYYQNNQPFWETSLPHINEKINISSGSPLCPITSKCKASIVLTVSSRDMGGLCLRPGADICQMQKDIRLYISWQTNIALAVSEYSLLRAPVNEENTLKPKNFFLECFTFCAHVQVT